MKPAHFRQHTFLWLALCCLYGLIWLPSAHAITTYVLTVDKAGTGTGTVTSTPAGIACGTTCSMSLAAGTVVTLKATPAADSTFSGWSGVCTGNTICTVTLSAAKKATATFSKKTHRLTANVAGTAGGTLNSNPSGISNCTRSCYKDYTSGTAVTLTAMPAADALFTGWSGSCTGTGTCKVTLTAAKTVTANFVKAYDLSLTKTGTGTGTITHSPLGKTTCSTGSTACNIRYPAGTVITLTATPAADSSFMGWGGTCAWTTASTCTVNLQAAQTVSATFTLKANRGRYWVTGYLPGYNQGSNGEIPYMMPIDWKTVTHVIHTAAMPNADGSLNLTINSIGAANRQAAIATAHAQGVPILLGLLGGMYVYQGVVDNPTLRAKLIQNLLALLDEGYDGLDIDLEPIVRWGEAENPGYEAFINELHAALQTRTTPLLSRPLLTVAAIYREHKLLARLQNKFDQINIMAYDQSGTMQGITWHDSALYAGGYRYPSTGNPVVSVDYYITTCLNAGIAPSKLGLGISLETRLWIGGEGTSTGGASQPMQTWTLAPRHFMTDGTVPQDSYAQLLDKYYRPENARWDEAARVPYLRFDRPGAADDMFISYNDERSVGEKLAYMRGKNLGGVMLWTLEKDFRPAQPPEKQRPIVQTIRQTLY